MIVLGNHRFVISMLLMGIKDSYVIQNREEGLRILKEIDKDDVIIVNASIIDILPELGELSNVVTIPDDTRSFGSIDDLKQMIKSAVGIEIQL